MQIPSSLRSAVVAFLELTFQKTVALQSFSFSSGGCINSGGRLKTSIGDFFLKWNDTMKFPGMFEAEAKGLHLLASTNAIDIPTVIGHGEDAGNQFILLNYIESASKKKNFWSLLGHQLAKLHQSTAPYFGLDHSNYIGSLKQFNDCTQTWLNFFIEKRLAIQVQLAIDGGKAQMVLNKKFERLYHILPMLLPDVKPSLIHGDLWSGNLMVNNKGEPCLIDPAVYYGSREMEIAFTKLFGGFDSMFYNAYNESFPLPANFNERVGLYNLYPLLVHVNLFGGHYLGQVNSILQQYI